MIYHLDVSFDKSLNGLDHAAITRFNLFKKHNIASRIITAKYNTDHNNIKIHGNIHGLGEYDIENMYDYFQDTCHIEEKPMNLADIFPYDVYKVIKISNSTDYMIYNRGIYTAIVHCLDDKTVSYINYFDSKQKKVKRCFYDCRGFLSSERILGQNQFVWMEIFYNRNGEKTIEKYYQPENEKSVLSMIRVKDKQKKWNHFYSEDELISFYLDSVVDEKNDLIIIDKNLLYDESVIKMNKRVKTISVLHSSHLRGKDHLKSRIKICYEKIFKNIERFDAVVASTQSQTQDIIERFDNAEKFFGIPVGFRKTKRQILLTNKFKLITVARLVREKRLEHVILAFSKVVDRIPEAELHLFGVGNKETELRKLVSDLNLNNSVKFRGYLSDLSNEYETSKLFLLSSLEEGFCQALMEAISHGIPAVSYDIKYGPSDLIENEKSGFLTSEDPEKLADKIVFLLSDPKLYEEFSNNAFAKSLEFDEEKIFEKWINIFKKINYKNIMLLNDTETISP